jgi:hypothetical protein
MSRTHLRPLVICVAIFCVVADSRASDPWTKPKVKIYPKSGDVILRGTESRVGPERAGTVYDIGWPVKALKVDGSWILIQDSGGYSNPPVIGWVNKEELTRADLDDPPTADDAGNYYTNELQKLSEGKDSLTLGKRATLQWLRGIYWADPAQEQYHPAAKDYVEAIENALGVGRCPPSLASNKCAQAVSGLVKGKSDVDLLAVIQRFPGIADAYLRLGMLSASKPEGPWEACFEAAKRLFELAQKTEFRRSGIPSQLYVAWAEAIMSCYRPERDAMAKWLAVKLATSKLSEALKGNKTWSGIYLAQGDIFLTISKGDYPPNGLLERPNPRALADTLRQAVTWYAHACRWDEDSADAFRKRGEALRLLAGSEDWRSACREAQIPAAGAQFTRLEEALNSLNWALNLKNYRDDGASLQTIAGIYGDLAEFYKSGPPLETDSGGRMDDRVQKMYAIENFTRACRAAKRGASPSNRDDGTDTSLLEQLALYYSWAANKLAGKCCTPEEEANIITLSQTAEKFPSNKKMGLVDQPIRPARRRLRNIRRPLL